MDLCWHPSGKQDQYIAAYGGLQFIRFNPDGTVFVDPVICAPETKRALQDGLLMLYTGMTRKTRGLLAEQAKLIRGKPDKQASMRKMVGLTHQLLETLQRNDLGGFGEILHAGWQEKRKLTAHISNRQIDGWYQRARRAGAIGGKILGAGGGGFLLLYAPPEKHGDILRALPELRSIPFKFSPQGSKVIYVEENGYH